MKPLLLFFLLTTLPASAQKLTITHLTGDYYVYTGYKTYEGAPFPSNGLYLVTKAGVVLIDTPWDSSDFQPLLDSIQKRHNKKVVFCLATHFHDDRTAGLDYYRSKGIATWSSAQTKQWCKKEGQPQAAHTFQRDTTFTVGGRSFRVFYPGKGHAPDNVVVWFEDAQILYGGCFVKSTESDGLGNLSHADVKAWPASVRKTMKAFPNRRYVIPGHFGWEGDGLGYTLKLLVN